MTPFSRPEEEYIASVIACIPASAMRSQIAMDLRSHIAERLEAGQPVDEVVRQLGDPAALAESYLGAVPLESASFGARAIAKIIDFALIAGICALICVVLAFVISRVAQDPGAAFFAMPVMVFVLAFGFPAYTVIAEYRDGRTIGKRLQGLRVVRESGAQISLGQALLRQLPWFFQIAMVDALFPLFTEKHQRAFEIISKTRVVKQPAD